MDVGFVAFIITLSFLVQIYGYQSMKDGLSSEQILGRLAKSTDQRLVLGTKFFTVPWTNVLIGGGFRLGRQAIIRALKASLGRLGLEKIDLYQVHFPFPAYSQEVLAEGFAEGASHVALPVHLAMHGHWLQVTMQIAVLTSC